MKIPKVRTNTPYTRLYGGLDTESPSLTIKPGSAIISTNYMCDTEGGYSRIDGYERFSGQPSPSAATYFYSPCSFTSGGPSVGDTITGADSGETGVVVVVGSDYINITKRSAAFNSDEVYTVGGSPKGTFTAAQAEKAETTAALHATAMNLAADVYRADISAPTGSGPGRGIVVLAGTVYCFRDNAGATAGLFYKSTASGWTAVTPGSEISFDTGVAAISDGDTVTQVTSGASAPVQRVVLESGSWTGGDASGRLILGTITGTFDATNDLQVSAATKATSTSLATSITLSPGGRYEFSVGNFTGSTATVRIYGGDGVNRGFEFDGTVYVPIDTGMTADTPVHVKIYKQQLFFSFLGSSQNSGIGTPYSWSALTGATEIAVGDPITGYEVEAESMLICSRNSTNQLSGDNASNFDLDSVDPEIGAIPYTIQSLGTPLCLDDRGVIDILRTAAFGNFNLGTVSRRIQRRINDMRSVAIASVTYKEKNQYRLFGSDGSGICLTVGLGREGPEYYYSQFFYPVNVACAFAGEDSTGKDVIYFMDDAGMAYQADKGTSFDGEEIESFLVLAFNNSKSPSVLKTYRKALIEMSAKGYVSMRFTATLDYGDTDIDPHIQPDLTIDGAGGYWDVANWDEFYWDSQVVGNPSLTLEGDGRNVSISIYNKSDEVEGFKIDGYILHFTPRRIVT